MKLPISPRGLAVTAVVALTGVGIGLYAGSEPKSPRSPSQQQAAGAPNSAVTPGPPADLRIIDYSGITLPISATDGPRAQRDALAAGFSRTPAGALMAAVHISVRSAALWGPKVFEPTISRQVIGPDKVLLLESSRSSYETQRTRRHLPAGTPLGRGYAVVEAFRWQTYTPDSATVDVVSAGPGDQGVTVRAATRIQVQWADGDWKVVAPPGGDWGNTATEIDSTDGYALLQEKR